MTSGEARRPPEDVESVPCRLETVEEIAAYFDRLWPLLRSLTGDGVRRTHDIIADIVPLQRTEFPSGAQCLDWTVPKEWVVHEAYLVDPNGRRILDVAEHNLHLVNYSVPFEGRVSRAALDEHLHSLPEQPDAIPYVTSYYAPRWGLCLTHRQREELPEGQYQVVIRTEHIDGSMTVSEAVLPGERDDEVLISTNTCHPSMANNELSGPLVAMFLYRRLASLPARRLTYRFVFTPETVGAIAYLSVNGQRLRERLVAGYVVTCVGNEAPFTYKRSRRGDSLGDRAAVNVFSGLDAGRAQIVNFVPWGSDERQYCSPGFDLPVGSLMRSPYNSFPQYHTSLDNRDFISFEALQASIEAYYRLCCALDANVVYRNLFPYGEPRLGARNITPEFTPGYFRNGSVQIYTPATERWVAAVKWVLNLADGHHDLLAIAERSGLAFDLLRAAAKACLKAGLVATVAEQQ